MMSVSPDELKEIYDEVWARWKNEPMSGISLREMLKDAIRSGYTVGKMNNS